jgi:hypothetical protein
LQKALAHLRPFVYMLPWFSESKIVDVNENIVDTDCRIYKIAGRYWIWSSECIIPKDHCDPCEYISNYCGCRYGFIKMRRMLNVPELTTGEYAVDCIWSKRVRYRLPLWVSKAYFVYYRMFDTLVDENSIIPIPEYLYPALQMLLAYHNATNGSYNAWDRAEYAQDFSNFIETLKQTFAEDIPSRFTFNNPIHV